MVRARARRVENERTRGEFFMSSPSAERPRSGSRDSPPPKRSSKDYAKVVIDENKADAAAESAAESAAMDSPIAIKPAKKGFFRRQIDLIAGALDDIFDLFDDEPPAPPPKPAGSDEESMRKVIEMYKRMKASELSGVKTQEVPASSVEVAKQTISAHAVTLTSSTSTTQSTVPSQRG